MIKVAGFLVAVVATGCAGAVQASAIAGPCHDVPSCPTDGASCYLQADDAGRLVDLWTCPTVPTGNTPGCFLAYGCTSVGRSCVTWEGNPDGGAPYTATCWIQYGMVANTAGVVGEHPVDFWVCPDNYADQCALTAATASDGTASP